MKNLIEIQGLKKIYQTGDVLTPILHGLDLQIKNGEFVAIMGPSGSGKSTLMHILSFLDGATQGKYFFEGIDVSTLSEEDLAIMRRDKVGFVFQAFFLLPRASVLENVMLPFVYSNKKNGKELALKALEQVGLSHRINYLPTNLSGGEKQRVAIARAIINSPSVIFADEPTGNLDSRSGIQVMQIFQKLNAEGHTIILVTHEATTAQHSERIIRIKDGYIEKIEKVENRIFAKDLLELKK